MRREHIRKVKELGLWVEGEDEIAVLKCDAAVMAVARLNYSGTLPADDVIRERILLAFADVDAGGDGV